uniref:(northern house mosquito) hypothetical protein n=2 Tax=Culex pipiens TaxID=7175 RepID=A0A8D8G5H7_CULPI
MLLPDIKMTLIAQDIFNRKWNHHFFFAAISKTIMLALMFSHSGNPIKVTSIYGAYCKKILLCYIFFVFYYYLFFRANLQLTLWAMNLVNCIGSDSTLLQYNIYQVILDLQRRLFNR